MSWGEELWDQYSQLEKHTEKGIDFLDRYFHFVKERQRIELEYASSLKRLIRNSQPKKKETEDITFSTISSFKEILTELQGIANQHDLIAEGLSTRVTKEVQAAVQEFKQERKKLLQDVRAKEAAKDKSIKKMDQSRDTYRQAYNAFIAAKQQFEKVDSDLSQSRAQVSKSKNNMMQKDQYREECKNDYILQLSQTNKDQHDHYYNQLPSVFKKIQELDERRIVKTSDFYKEYAECHRSVLPIISKCLDCITQQAEQVNPEEDSRKVCLKYKSGLVPPEDFQMLDLDEPAKEEPEKESDAVSGNSVSSNSGGTERQKGKKGKRGIRSIWTKPEPVEDFSHLQPHQQRRELQKKIDELQGQVDQEIKSKEALLKMREVYTKNPTLGDPASVEGQLALIGKKVDALRLELQKYQNYKAAAEGKTATPQGTPQSTPQSTPHGTPHSTPIADRSGSMKKAGSTPSVGEAASEERQPASNQSSPSRELPRSNETVTDHALSPGDSITSPVSSRQESFYEDMEDEFEDHPQCKAKFQFHSADENSLNMEVDDVLEVMEEDTGDGWTRVRRGNEEGFVPTSYLEFDS